MNYSRLRVKTIAFFRGYSSRVFRARSPTCTTLSSRVFFHRVQSRRRLFLPCPGGSERHGDRVSRQTSCQSRRVESTRNQRVVVCVRSPPNLAPDVRKVIARLKKGSMRDARARQKARGGARGGKKIQIIERSGTIGGAAGAFGAGGIDTTRGVGGSYGPEIRQPPSLAFIPSITAPPSAATPGIYLFPRGSYAARCLRSSRLSGSSGRPGEWDGGGRKERRARRKTPEGTSATRGP